MQNNNTILIVIAVIVLIAAFYFINQNNKSKTAADVAIQEMVPPCIPFTKSQQDEQKKELNKICAKKQFIPVIGPFQFASCIAKVDVQLTPVKTCP